MRKLVVAMASLSFVASGCSTYGPQTAPPSRPGAAQRSAPSVADIVLTAAQIALVRSHFANNGGPGRGRGRNGGLPPGIAKNLARGKPLPPGIAKQYLPSDLLGRLPPIPTGLEYVVVAGKLLLVEAATQMVRQILLDAVF